MAQVEVLAPAGSMESFRAAVNAGADAVYIGGNLFGARAYADNFDEEQLKEALDIAHIHGRKLYLTVNTLLKNNELYGQLYDFLAPVYENGLDAVIVQDFGVFCFVKEYFPKLDIHASTQMTINGAGGAELLKQMGASRVVTSRELSLEEIRDIYERTGMEIESFVHGALCYSYSGQCLLSSVIGGRSGNRGRCAQPCRLLYMALDENNGVVGKKDRHILSPKDICTLEILPDIIEAGVYSLKIEGRMKNPLYTAGVVSVYRKYVDLYERVGKQAYRVEEQDIRDLMDLYNRGNFTKGYYTMHNGFEMMCMDRANHQGVCAFRVAECRKGEMQVLAVNDLFPQDVVEIAPDFMWTGKTAHKKGEKFTIRLPRHLTVNRGDVFYRVKNNALNSRIEENYIKKNIKRDVEIYGTFTVGQPCRAGIRCGDVSYEIVGNVVEAAKSSPVTTEQLIKQLSKMGNTEFTVKQAHITADDAVFVSVQELNEMRRTLAAGLTKRFAARRKPERRDGLQCGREQAKAGISKQDTKISVTVYDRDILQTVLAEPFIDRIYYELSAAECSELQDIAENIHESGKEAYLVLPYIFRKRTEEFFKQNGSLIQKAGFDGYLIKNLEELVFLADNKFEGKFFLDSTIYCFNDYAEDFFRNYDISGFTVPLELNRREIGAMNNANREMIVYGTLPVMVSAQCVMKNVCEGGCALHTDREINRLYLRDRMGKLMPVVNFCTWCYNVIYNSSVLNLLNRMEEIEQCGIGRVRIDLCFVKADKAKRIIRSAVDAVYYHKESDMKGDFTKGHFLRGVE